MIIIANVIWALSVADCVVAVLVPMSQMAFIEAGNKPKEWANPAWNAIVKVRFSNTKLFQSSNPPPPVPLQCTIANSIALLADIVLVRLFASM